MKLATVHLDSAAGPATAAVRIQGDHGVVIPGAADVGSLLSTADWHERAAAADGPLVPLDRIARLIEHPGKVVCVGLNYRAHITEMDRLRAREVWLRAVDLDNGAVFADLPGAFCDRLLLDVVTSWRRAGVADDLVLVPTDRAVAGLPAGPVDGAGPVMTITGTVTELTRWASGRGTEPGGRPISDTGTLPTPPRWL